MDLNDKAAFWLIARHKNDNEDLNNLLKIRESSTFLP